MGKSHSKRPEGSGVPADQTRLKPDAHPAAGGAAGELPADLPPADSSTRSGGKKSKHRRMDRKALERMLTWSLELSQRQQVLLQTALEVVDPDRKAQQ